MSTRSARRRRAAAARRSATGHTGQSTPTPEASASPRLSLVKRPALPRRPRPGTYAPGEIAEGRAAAAAIHRGITALSRRWHARPTGGAAQYLADGTMLHHPGNPGGPFSAVITCVHGAAHVYLVPDPRSLWHARHAADTCAELHADLTGLANPAVSSLADAFRGAHLGHLIDEADRG